MWEPRFPKSCCLCCCVVTPCLGSIWNHHCSGRRSCPGYRNFITASRQSWSGLPGKGWSAALLNYCLLPPPSLGLPAVAFAEIMTGAAQRYVPSVGKGKGRAVLGGWHADRRDLTSWEGFCPGLQKEETLGLCPLMAGECRYNAWQCHAAIIPSSSHLKSGSSSHQHRGKSSSELRWEFNHLFHCAILTFFKTRFFSVRKNMDFPAPETTAWELFLPTPAESTAIFYGCSGMLRALQSHCG